MSLRITSSILSRQALSGMQTQMRALEDAQRRVSTGIDVQRASDDPVAAAGILESSSGLRALEQYRSNVENGQARLALEDSVLEQITNALTRAKEVTVQAVNDTSDARARDNAREEIEEIADHLRMLANTQFNGAFLFGGQYADSPPYDATGAWDPTRPPSGATRVEIGSGEVADTNHSAQEVFIDSDVVDTLDAIAAALDINDVAGAQTGLSRLDTAFQAVQELVGEVGGRANRLEHTAANIDSLEVTLSSFRSELSEADLAEAISDLVNRQTSLEAAMLANARILDITLADYL